MQVEFSGLVDIQVNGFGGIDYNSPDITADRVLESIAALRATGVTRVLPTLITGSLERFERCAKVLASIGDPAVAGIHMEGPYISPVDGARGAHPREHTRAATRDDFARRQEAAGGRIVLVTLAPEVPGAVELTAHLAESGVQVAIGHTDAAPAAIREAISAGATLSTHLGNGCAAVLPRHPNVIWEQLAADELHASIIVDGHHLPPSTVKAIAKAKGPLRTILTTDAIAAAGCPEGVYRIGDVEVEIGPDRRPSLRGTPFLAGSALSMDAAIGNMVRFTGLALSEVLNMASAVPAAYLGISPAGMVSGEWDPEACVLEITDVRG